MFAAMRRGYSIEEIQILTGIDGWFLTEMAHFVTLENALRQCPTGDPYRSER